MKMRGVRFTDEQWSALTRIACELNSSSVRKKITASDVIRQAVDSIIKEYSD